MKVNKFVKKHRNLCVRLWNIKESIWELIEKVPGVGPAIIQDFYPFKLHGPRFKWYEPFTNINYWRHSILWYRIEYFGRWHVRPFIEKVQKFIIGKKHYQVMNWLVNCNDSKLLEQWGWDATVRSRGSNVKYFDFYFFPLGYAVIKQREYIGNKSGKNINLFGRFVEGLLAVNAGEEDKFREEAEDVKEIKTTVFSGWVKSQSDLFRLVRAYFKAYEEKKDVLEERND